MDQANFDIAAALAAIEGTQFVGRPEDAQEWAEAARDHYIQMLKCMLTIGRQKKEIEDQDNTITRMGKINKTIAYMVFGEAVLIVLLIIGIVLRTV